MKHAMVRMPSYLVACFIVVILIAAVTFGFGPFSSTASPSATTEEYGYSGDNTDRTSASYHYGVIIDAGSSGSRVFVYIWPSETGGRRNELIRIRPLIDEETARPVVKKVTPGLSTYGENVTGAVSHAAELLAYAESKIPKEKHKETSLFLMATAGMRLLPQEQQDAVLKELREELPKLCDFIIMDQHIEIISGKWEGIYSWIAVNYALHRFDNARPDPSLEMLPVYDEKTNQTFYRKPTVGMIDMGGGSVQIGFEISDKVPRMQEHMTADLNLGYDEHDVLHLYKLYVTTFLGFGANVAQTRYEKQLADRLERKIDVESESSSTITPPVVRDPCLPINLHKTVVLDDIAGSSPDRSTNAQTFGSYTRKGVGVFDQCQLSLNGLLNTTSTCLQSPCSFNGVYQPSINFSAMEFYGFSEYWYSTEDVLDVGGPWSYDRFRQEATKFCATKWSTLKHAFDNKLYPKADLLRMKTECFKAAWISVVLHDGFGVPRNVTTFKTVSQINDEEVQWTLGALLYRMRHFPLREMQKLRELQMQPPKYRKAQSSYYSYIGFVPSNALSQLLLLACIVVVLLAAVKYFCFLRRYKRLPSPSNIWNGGSKMPRNRSMYTYMTMGDTESNEPTPLLQGIRIERSSYIY